MRGGIFGKITAYCGIITGILGVLAVLGPIFVSALSLTIIVASLSTTVWLFLAGWRLCTLAAIPTRPAPAQMK
jgi:hypothetical protein